MVQEILKNIENKALEEISKIEEEKEKTLSLLRKKYQEKLEKEKEINLQNFQEKTKSVAKDTLLQKKAELNFALLSEKNRIIEDVYKKAEKEIISLPDEEFKKWILKFIPKKSEGEIRAGKRTASILKKILDNKIKDDLEEEGFLVITETVEVDFRIGEILKRLKEEQNPEIIKILCLNTPQE